MLHPLPSKSKADPDVDWFEVAMELKVELDAARDRILALEAALVEPAARVAPHLLARLKRVARERDETKAQLRSVCAVR
jgi:hypothetical protein